MRKEFTKLIKKNNYVVIGHPNLYAQPDRASKIVRLTRPFLTYKIGTISDLNFM